MWGVCLAHPVLASFLSGKFLLHIPCWLYISVGSFSYTSHAGFFFSYNLGSFSSASHAGFIFTWGVSLTHSMLTLFLCGTFFSFFLLPSHAGVIFYLGSISYPSRAGFIFIWGVSLIHPVLALISSGDFLLHISSWIYFSVGRFSYTYHPGIFFLFFSFFFFYSWEFSYTSHAGFIFI